MLSFGKISGFAALGYSFSLTWRNPAPVIY